MTDYTTSVLARACLTDNKITYNGTDANVKAAIENYKDGYSAICEFLTNKPGFDASLMEVSKWLWWAYRKDASESNKFTRALSVVGRKYGFSVHLNFQPTIAAGVVTSSSPIKYKLVGNDSGLGYFLRNKLFWKDSMEAQHGEHSHSLQWLAIANANLGTTIPITDLYKESGNFSMKGTDGGAKADIYLWAWLADSFPSSMKDIGDSKKLGGTGDNLTTTSYRSPQNITTYLVKNPPIDGHFVSNYLYYKYTKNKWATIKEYQGQEILKVGGAISGNARYKSPSPTWQQSGRQPNRMLRQNFADKTKARAAAEFKFHGHTGNLYNLPIN